MSATDMNAPITSLSPDWKLWIARNLMLEMDVQSIMQVLVNAGMPVPLVVQEVKAAAESPYVMAGVSLARQVKKRDWLLSVYQQLANDAMPGRTVERRDNLSKAEFLERYYSKNVPVVITDAIKDWAPVKNWTPAYLKEKYGHCMVEIQADRNSDPLYELNSDQLKKQVQFSDYVDRITQGDTTNDYYMTANNSQFNNQSLAGLFEEIDYWPTYFDPNNRDGRQFFWFGPAGTVTPLHHDMTNNFMAQIKGRKHVKLISSQQLPLVYNHRHCFSEIDVGNPDVQRYPQFNQAQVIDLILEPGDLFFLPIGWWHYIVGLDTTITLTFTNFAFPNNFMANYHTLGTI